jgi:hypothetical protein
MTITKYLFGLAAGSWIFHMVACSSTASNNTNTSDGGAVDGGGSSSGQIDSGTLDAGPSDSACAKQTTEVLDGNSILVCLETYTTGPLVRLPADGMASSDGQIVYGAIGQSADFKTQFITRTASYPLPEGEKSLLRIEADSLRYAYYVYRAQIKDNAVQALTPVIRMDDRVFQKQLAGLVLEGKIAARERIEDGYTRYKFDMNELPIRIRLAANHDQEEADKLRGFPRYALRGIIENANAAVTASDGSCLKSLASFGEKSPLFDAKGKVDQVTILRHPNMHGGLDDVFTLDWAEGVGANNMGTGLFVSVPMLIATEMPVFSQADNLPHGTPWGGPGAELKVVATSGGSTCTP